MSTLYLVATPIGNLEDLSYRAARILSEVDAIAAEDTRVTRKIYERYQLSAPAIRFACHDHNEEQAVHRILDLLNADKTVALCTDGGMPTISDPGYRVVNACQEHGHAIVVVPGPSAATTALAASGLPPNSFTFKGFPPRKPGARQRFLEQEQQAPHTLIFFESPHRLSILLQDALAAYGNRQAAVCIELTKQYERVVRASLAELCAQFDQGQPVKGEITVVIAGSNPKFAEEPEPDEQDDCQSETDIFLYGKKR